MANKGVKSVVAQGSNHGSASSVCKDDTRNSLPLNSAKGYALTRKTMIGRERSTATYYSSIKAKMETLYQSKALKK